MMHRNIPRNPGPVYKSKWSLMACHSTPSSPSGWKSNPNANNKSWNEKEVRKYIDIWVPGPKMNPVDCIADKKDMTVFRSSS